ncbi:hypothetical protein ETQ85_06405 [Zoogloea oleivorans]|uniref:Glycosyltransferase RgtA/B/C/D-like domain-containing protein n=1 Tax=Zoogloea oleivorans TaxID=1552750 RepID=A0A6C2D282_9RHOO|nr:hypothetical protein [Zoogloea oleivorans]TYC60136.1 hypothetical protein ETQ85_06405 [Zoogloea oleivorans]
MSSLIAHVKWWAERGRLGSQGLALLFGGAFGLAMSLVAWSPDVALGLILPIVVSVLWAETLRARAGFSSLAGGWVLAVLLLLAVLAGLGLLGVPAVVVAAILIAVLGVGCYVAAPALCNTASSAAPLVLLLFLASVALLFWGESAWTASVSIATGGQQKIWQDWYFHGALIDMLAQGAVRPVHDLRGVGLPLAPYHYLSYGLPAWLESLTGASGLGLALTLWWPLGLLLLVAAGSEWVARLRPDFPWLAVLLPLMLFWPDAAALGSGQRFLGWHWLQTISPGSLYGCAAALLLTSWLAGQWQCATVAPSRTLLIMAGALAVSMFFKAQIILLAGPLLLFWWGGTLPGGGGRRRMLTGGMAIVALVILLWLPLPGLPLMRLGGGGWREYWPALLHLQEAGWLSGLRAGWMAPFVILAGTLGWMLVGILAWPRAPWPVRYWMLLLIGGYLLFALGLDPDNRGGAGTPEEVQHRPLVWVLPMWWLTTGPFLFPDSVSGMLQRRWSGVLCTMMVVVVGCIAGAAFGPGVQRGPGSIAGTPALSKGMVEAAAFIRKKARAGDICQNADADPQFRWAALSQCAPYWIGFNLHARSTGPVRERAAEWLRIRGLPAVERVEAFRRAGIRWYSAGPFPPGRGDVLPDDSRLPLTPAFQSGDGYVVYQIPS